MAKEIPILFSTPMVQAILDDRKTQTRRIVKPQPIDNTEIDGNFFEGNHKGYVKVDGHSNWQQQFEHEFAKWKPGDILWVRETWKPKYVKGGLVGFKLHYPDVYPWIYAADGEPEKGYGSFKPSIHMPKEAARIWLQVEDVRVERLKDITEADANAEGVQPAECSAELRSKCRSSLCKEHCDAKGTYYNYPTDFEDDPCYSAVESFEQLWKMINGNGSWNINPE